MSVPTTQPDPRTITVTHYDITLSCGKTQDFYLRADLGDTAVDAPNGDLILTLAASGHKVTITRKWVAMCSVVQVVRTLMPEPEESKPSGLAKP